MAGFCPHCGFNMTADVPVRIGPWNVAPDQVRYEGLLLDVNRSEASLMHTLAKAGGRTVSNEVILSRMSSTAETIGIVPVLVHKLRGKLGDLSPIETVRGGGYRWAMPGPARAREAD